MSRSAHKARERLQVEEAGRILGANWEIVEEREEPDFFVSQDGRPFGLEVTSAFVDLPSRAGSRARQRESDNQSKLDAVRLLWEKETASILNVAVLGDLEGNYEREILDALGELQARSLTLGSPSRRTETVSGLKVYVSAACRPEWTLVTDGVGWVDQNALPQIQAAIDAKSSRVATYSTNVNAPVRLLVVADYSKASGMLELATPWQIDKQNFEKVYFLPWPGGEVTIIED